MSNYSPKHPGSGGSESKKPVKKSKKGSKLNKALIAAILVVLAIIIAAAAILIFVPGAESGIGSFLSGKPAYVPETQSETTIISKYYENGILPTSGSRHDYEVIEGGGANARDLEGSWRLDQITVYEFDGKGRGIMLTAVDNYTFLYSAQDGKLIVDYDGDGGTDREYDYVIDGDKLTLTLGTQKYEFTKNDAP